MPQLLYPGNPIAMGVEVGGVAYLLGLEKEKALGLGVIVAVYNMYIQKNKNPLLNFGNTFMPESAPGRLY